MNFEQKVKSLTFKQILGHLITGLENPKYQIDMSVFALISDGVCFGCAATNAIVDIWGEKFPQDKFASVFARSEFMKCSEHFYPGFELSLESLRCGEIEGYNEIAKKIGIALCPVYVKLPILTGYDYKRGIEYYKEFYDSLPD